MHPAATALLQRWSRARCERLAIIAIVALSLLRGRTVLRSNSRSSTTTRASWSRYRRRRRASRFHLRRLLPTTRTLSPTGAAPRGCRIRVLATGAIVAGGPPPSPPPPPSSAAAAAAAPPSPPPATFAAAAFVVPTAPPPPPPPRRRCASWTPLLGVALHADDASVAPSAHAAARTRRRGVCRDLRGGAHLRRLVVARAPPSHRARFLVSRGHTASDASFDSAVCERRSRVATPLVFPPPLTWRRPRAAARAGSRCARCGPI